MNNLLPTREEIACLEILVKNASESKFFQQLGGFSGMFTISMYARELGLPPMQCLFGGMKNVMGRIEISPQIMNGMIRRAGHKLEILDSTNEFCTIKGTRNDTSETCTVTFSVEDAKRAKIYKAGGAWETYPSDMCFARAISRLSRRLFPDVIGVAYVENEIEVPSAKKDLEIRHEDINPVYEEPEPIKVPSFEEVTEGMDAEQLHKWIFFAAEKSGKPIDHWKIRFCHEPEKCRQAFEMWREKQVDDTVDSENA